MVIKIGMKPSHPSAFNKRSILPDDLTVTGGAKALGVSRLALSNLLNQKASLAPEMTLRIEKAFGVQMETILRMQARYDAYHMRAREQDITVQPFTAKTAG